MKQLTIATAKQRLLAASPGLYAGVVSDLDVGRPRAYESHGAVLLKTLWSLSGDPRVDGITTWYICDLGGSDLTAARRALKRKPSSRNSKRATYSIGECNGDNCLMFSRLGERYDDPHIRPLNEEDCAAIRLILQVSEDDSEDAKAIAGVIRDELAAYMRDPTRHFLGLFEGTALQGVLAYHNQDNSEIITISDVFVPQALRGRGYAARLVRAATAVHPGTRYVYSCGSQNAASIATAKKAGYMLAGTCDFW